MCFLAVNRLEDVGALVDDNLFERDILIATKKLASLSNIAERTQGNKPVYQYLRGCFHFHMEYAFYLFHFREKHES